MTGTSREFRGVQNDHVHLIVEASDKSALARGMQGLCVRLARHMLDAETWLASAGWRRHGLVGLDERPRAPD